MTFDHFLTPERGLVEVVEFGADGVGVQATTLLAWVLNTDVSEHLDGPNGR
jgi:hypothetical protein